MRYVQYVADHLALPRPDAGWQFFQSPLYYILSAILDRAMLGIGVAATNVPYLLRIIPLLCGAAMSELCYRAARLAFPGRFDLHAIAATVGGLMPVNIYMAQSVSNEPMAAVMAGLITLLALHFLHQPGRVRSSAYLLTIGAVFGAGLLTKASIVIWIAPLGAAIGIALLNQRLKAIQWWRAIGIICGGMFCLSGWYFVRNFLLTGKLFYLQSSVAQTQWWQDPGYRTPWMFVEFGHVFTRPIFNGLASVWDSLYGTMWGDSIIIGHPPLNFGLMSCGLWLGLMPMGAVLVGMCKAILKQNPSLCFGVLSIACFIPAILYVYLTLPIYSCAKASYMLGTLPCIALLAAAGFDTLMYNRLSRAIATGLIFCWAATAYLTFFIAG